jgi:hypothetical protein
MMDSWRGSFLTSIPSASCVLALNPFQAGGGIGAKVAAAFTGTGVAGAAGYNAVANPPVKAK